MSALLADFLSPARTSLKICGVTRADDATRLAELGVHALGVNFWEGSKRHCPLDTARRFLPALRDRILRVGVFVNADPALPRRLLDEDLIDLVQFHGDETIADCMPFVTEGLPFLKAIGVSRFADLEAARGFPANGLLLDAHAPGIYGGTGQTIDWDVAARFVTAHPTLPIILAGGLTPENAAAAVAVVHPAALDVASGAESAPGHKDFAKVEALLSSLDELPPENAN